MVSNPLPLRQRLTVQLSAAFALLFVLFASALGFSLYLAQQRETDIAVIHTAERLRRLALNMQHQADNYLRVPARDYDSFYRDVKLYYRDLRRHSRAFEEELTCFVQGRFPSGVGADAGAGTYRLDVAGEPAVRAALTTWRGFQTGLARALGDDREQPRLEYAASYVQGNAGDLLAAASALHERFSEAALARLDAGRKVNRAVVAVAILLLALIMWWSMRALRPLRAAVSAFRRVSRGDLDYRVNCAVRNELGVLSAAFNAMADRLRAVMRLLDGLHQCEEIRAALQVVQRELAVLMPVEWVGVLKPDGGKTVLYEFAVSRQDRLGDGAYANVPAALLQAESDGAPLRIPELAWLDVRSSEADLLDGLRKRGFRALMAIPLPSHGLLLAGSKRPHAYLLEHQELLDNLAPFLGHALARFLTNGAESAQRVLRVGYPKTQS